MRTGETLISVNGHAIRDVLDYRFYTYEPSLAVVVADETGETRTVRLRKAEGEDPGLAFESYLMDNQQSCCNQCLFCFIDQLPPGLRRTLYFKDDDARLSFLLGQYITMTNLTRDEIDRILAQRVSPLHISVHATNPDIRQRLLGHPNAGHCLDLMRELADRGIQMHAQVVVCPGINDGQTLQDTLNDLSALYPAVASVSVVPVGLTKHRAGLFPLRPFDSAGAQAALELVEEMGAHNSIEHGVRVVYAADELYLLAGRPLPDESAYDGYPQLENGVGMMTLFETEFFEAVAEITADRTPLPFTLATGRAAAPFMQRLLEGLSGALPDMRFRVIAASNRLFGDTVDVAGLLCGRDLVAALHGQVLGSRVLIPASMLRHGGDLFLDDLTPLDVAREIGAQVIPVPVDGKSLIDAILSGMNNQ